MIATARDHDRAARGAAPQAGPGSADAARNSSCGRRQVAVIAAPWARNDDAERDANGEQAEALQGRGRRAHRDPPVGRIRLTGGNLCDGGKVLVSEAGPGPLRGAQAGTASRLRAGRPDVLRRRPDQPALALLLEDVRRPAGGARAGEQRREQVRRHLGVVEHDGRPELDVRRQHAVGLARVQLGERGLLERFGDLDARRAELARGAAQHAGARVLGAVDAVAEAHQPLAAVERVLDPAARRRRGARPRRASSARATARRRAAGPTARRRRATARRRRPRRSRR